MENSTGKMTCFFKKYIREGGEQRWGKKSEIKRLKGHY